MSIIIFSHLNYILNNKYLTLLTRLYFFIFLTKNVLILFFNTAKKETDTESEEAVSVIWKVHSDFP